MVQNDPPRTPPGWEAFSGTLVRLANDDGDALAWLVPEYGANCVAYMVLAHGAWVPLLHHDGPEALAARPSRFGCAILFPFPGHMRDFHYAWQGETFTIPRRGSSAADFTHGFAHTRPWQIADVAPDRATMTFFTPEHLAPDERAGYPFAIRLTQTAAITGKTLRISVQATNDGDRAAPVGLGLHPYFSVAALGGDRAQVRVRLPGQEEHVLTPPIPTGKRRPVVSPDIAMPPADESGHVARTTIASGARAILRGGAGDEGIAVTLVEGVRDVVCFTPPDQPSISIEPHTCAPSAASQPEGHPDGLVALAPGAHLTMTIEIALTISADT